MPQCLAYQTDIHVMLIGDARPGMAHHVGGERTRETCQLGEPMQRIVVSAKAAGVLLVQPVGRGGREYREDILGIGSVVSLHDATHLGQDSHSDGLPRLVSGVFDKTLPYLALLEISDVYERHPHGMEAKDEEVSG